MRRIIRAEAALTVTVVLAAVLSPVGPQAGAAVRPQAAGAAVSWQAAVAADEGRFRPAAKEGIPGAYVVVLADVGVDQPEKVDGAVDALLASHPGKLEFTYRHVLPGFAVRMAESDAIKLSQDDRVAYVEQQKEMTYAGEQLDPPWGLDLIDQRSGLDDAYRFDADGTGVHAYIMDSGIRRTHADFEGRASGDVSFVPPGIDTWGTGDCHGHGTAMAGLVGGRTHGVAKRVRLHTVRIGGCAGATTAMFIAGADWVAVNADRPAVVNLSAQARADSGVDAAANGLLARGISVVTAAGNANLDACGFSPARVPGVITVGAVHALRDRLESSSWGRCVDLFAPGERITTTSNAGDTATTEATGTSVAAAHVTGAVARYLQRQPTAYPELVARTLADEATKDRITDIRDSPNLILYTDRAGPGNDGFSRTGADVNGDGRDDIVTFVRGAPADVWVALSTGSSFGPGQLWHEYFGAANEIPMLGDVNADGRDDLITFQRGASADVYVALSTGTAFGPAQRWHTWFAAFAETPAVGDFNGDGRADIATFTRGDAADVYVALSDGTRFVGSGVRWHGNFAGRDAMPFVGDVNGDGRDDVIAVNRLAGDVWVALSLGGTFTPTAAQWRSGVSTGTRVPVIGDFDGNGRADLAMITRGSFRFVEVYLSTGTVFGNPGTWLLNFAGGTQVPGAGDFTGDSRDDLVEFTRGQAADVYVAASSGWSFGPSNKWHDWFAFGLEIPMPAVLW